MKEHLLSITTGTFGLCDDVIESTRKLVRKAPVLIPELLKCALIAPKVIDLLAKRSKKADERAEKKEDKAQAAVATGQEGPTLEEALDDLQDVIAAFAELGVPVTFREVAGELVVVAVLPEHVELVEKIMSAKVGAVVAVTGVASAKATATGAALHAGPDAPRAIDGGQPTTPATGDTGTTETGTAKGTTARTTGPMTTSTGPMTTTTGPMTTTGTTATTTETGTATGTTTRTTDTATPTGTKTTRTTKTRSRPPGGPA